MWCITSGMLVQQFVQSSECLWKESRGMCLKWWFAALFKRDGPYIGLENCDHSSLSSLCGGDEKLSLRV